MSALREIVGRLAAGSRGRTEADVQADVRQFLLAAPLELADDDVIDVSLEAPAGGGRRIDVEAGCAAIEVKKSLASPTAFDRAVTQLAGYVKQRTDERGQRYVGVLTDGATWVLFRLRPDGVLMEVSRFLVTHDRDGGRLAAWLEGVLVTVGRIRPTPREIVRRLGAGSPAAQLDLADLRALYDTCRESPEVQLKRELWARLLLSALGTNFEDSDDLFVTHTYLVLAAELVAHEVMDIPVVGSPDLRALLEGQQFDLAGLHGVVEADFFDWPVAVPAGAPIVRAIARRLSQFAWDEVEHDVLKVLYESVIDSQTRKQLGEYYTPDWLAQKIVDEQFTDPLTQRMLDPSCGSGTFLFWAVRRTIAACDAERMDNRATLEHVVEHVCGMDLHPVAVTLARVTYLLAVTPDRLRLVGRGEISVPVFLGDSLRWEHDDTVLTEDGITVYTSDRLELFDQDLHFPESVVEQPARFDRLVAALAEKASKRPTRAVPKIGGLMKAHKVEEQDKPAVELVFTKLCRLHDAGRDHLWGYYIRNLARPLAFTRPQGQVDVLAGNPPWLAFRHMTRRLQATYQRLSKARGLWAGGRGAANQDLSDLFVVRSVEQYLKPGGRFAFVMPFAVLSRFPYAGFRTASWSSAVTPETRTRVAFNSPEEFAKVKPPLFNMPACVVSGTRTSAARPLSAAGVSWSGRVRSHHIDWAAAREVLQRTGVATELASEGQKSPYRARFRKGATLIPRVLVKVVERDAGPLGTPAGLIPLESSRIAVEKPPWKSLRSLTGAVEQEFVCETHLGATIVPFRIRAPELAVIPWSKGRLLDGDDEELDLFPGLAAWWQQAEREWDRHKADSTRLTLREQIDFQGKITAQFPLSPHRVVYTTHGQYLAAARVEASDAIVEQTLYWTAVGSAQEGRYLCAILNSDVIARAVGPLQARGQHNPRHFAMGLFAVPFPIFDPADRLHSRLATLGVQAEDVANSLDFEDGWQFQKARRITRDALREDGVAAEIDDAVAQLIAEAIDTPVPDLLQVLSEGERAAQQAPVGTRLTSGRLQKRRQPSPGAESAKGKSR